MVGRVMSDKQLAAIARNLAKTLIRFARERDEPGRKEITILQTELCAVYRAELEQQQVAEPAPDQPGAEP
jgi:ribonuclease D